MDVVSTCPLRVAKRVWPPARGRWALTVVCKATYLLLPGESPLNPEQDEPNEEDNYWDDNPERSLYSPADLVPFKERADIVLVGHAFSPGGAPARSILTRLIVNDIEKSIEAFCDRSFSQDGQLREGPMVTKVSLRYERAAGGPSTANPAGVRLDMPDIYGAVQLPNLQPAGKHVSSRGDHIDSIGYGPIAPTWPSRREKLGPHAPTWNHAAWYKQPLPDGVDPAFFNVAPADQQVNALRDNERIILENLHPEHPRLVTNLCGIRPRAVVHRDGRKPELVAMLPDTLWIDTARGLCTLVWRGLIHLHYRDEAGQITISLDEQRGASVPFHQASRGAPPTPDFEDAVSVTETVAPDTHRAAASDPDAAETMPIRLAKPRVSPVMPFITRPSEPSSSAAPSSPGLPWSSAPELGAGESMDEAGTFDGVHTAAISRADVLNALPFKSGPEARPIPGADPPVPIAIVNAGGEASHMPVGPWQLTQSVTAAESAPPSPSLPPAPPMIGPLATPDMAASWPPQQAAEAETAALPAVAPSTPGAPSLPVIDFPLEKCAAIAASIARTKEHSANILDENEVKAADWPALERRWTDAIRKETDRGKTALLRAYDAAYVAQLEKERGPIQVNEYARLVVASERGSAGDALAELTLPRGAMMRIERVWLTKIADDAELAVSVRKAIEAARAD